VPLGASYTLDLTVTNSFGSADFEGAYTLTVIEYIAPIEPETFSYAPVAVVRQAFRSSCSKPGREFGKHPDRP